MIAFDSLELRNVCEDSEQADRCLGLVVGMSLRNRLADLRAARSPNDLCAGQPRYKVYDGNEHLVIALPADLQIRLVPNHTKTPKDADGNIAWARVSRVKVVGISNNDSEN